MRSRFVFGEDRFRVLGAEAIDVSDRLFKALDALDADLVVEVFGPPVLFGRCLDGDIELSCHFAYHLITMDAHFRRCKLTQQLGQARTRDAVIDQHRLTGIAHTHTLGLRIQHDRIRLGKIGGFMDVDMAIPCARFDDRNERMLHAVPNEPCPTARNEHIDQIAQ